jgi:hypothetical protein
MADWLTLSQIWRKKVSIFNDIAAKCLILKIGERGRNRTFNLLIKSQLLCQLSYAPFAFGMKRGASEEDDISVTQAILPSGNGESRRLAGTTGSSRAANRPMLKPAERRFRTRRLTEF